MKKYFTSSAALVVNVSIAIVLFSGCKSNEGEVSTATPVADGGIEQLQEVQSHDATAAPAKFDLNNGTKEQYLTIPGFSDRMVREFFEYRPYVSIQQFRKEMGKYVDEATIAGYEKYVYVPVDPNNCDSETLQQLPGVESSIAEELLLKTPYESKDAFLTELSTYVTAEQLEDAGAYLVAE